MDELRTKTQMSPKDFFVHLGIIVTLYASATALMVLLFQIINSTFADQLFSSYDPYSSAMRFAVATLIILFPVFIVLSWVNSREYVINPEKRNLWIRRWAIYLTLFIGGAVILGDLITLLNIFLGGEITTRFVLKVLVIFTVASVVFGYYLYEILRKDFTSSKNTKIFLIASIVLVVGSIILGFVVVGSPTRQRLIREDDKKIEDLSMLQSQIINYVSAKGVLPKSLEDLSVDIGYVPQMIDSQTNQRYEYIITSEMAFQLCATFNIERKNGAKNNYMYLNESWDHPAGRHCFDRTIDKDFLPKVIKGFD